MTPFLRFRIWFRRASIGQRAATALSVLAAVALVVWSAVPSDTGSSASAGIVSGQGSIAAGGSGTSGTGASGSTVPGSAGSAGSSGGATGTSGTSGSGSSTSGSSSGSTGSDNGSSGTIDNGVPTATASCAKRGTVKVGIVVPTGAGGTINAAIGAPPQAEEQADYAAVVDDLNKAGGMACDTIVADFATSDLTNPSSARSGCLQFVQDKVFAVVGGFEPLFSDDCTLQAHIPTFDELSITAGDVQKFYPYYFSTYPTYERLYKNFVNAVAQMGYFSSAKKFAKIGIFYDDCTPEIQQTLIANLATVGVSGSKVDTYDLGCSTAFASPSAIEQAVLKFKTDGVTTATISDSLADGQNISNISNSQGFHPAWILPDIGEIAVQNSSSGHPDSTEFEGATAITAGQYGAIPAHFPEDAGTQRCDRVMTSHHLPTVYNSADQFAGSTCSLMWMLVAAVHKAGLNQSALAAGLQATKTVQMSFPSGPNDFSVAGTTAGGEFWRADTYHGSCQCWVTNNPAWQPSF